MSEAIRILLRELFRSGLVLCYVGSAHEFICRFLECDQSFHLAFVDLRYGVPLNR